VNARATMAYLDGLRAGRIDRYLGVRSEYAWDGYDANGLGDLNPYAAHYSRGYRAAWRVQ